MALPINAIQNTGRPAGLHQLSAVSFRALGAALLLMLVTGFPARAGDILRGGAGASSGGGSAAGANAAAATQSAIIAPRAQDVLRRTTQALQAVQAMQAAARSAAVSGPNNLGADPNHAGLQLPNVPNGLVTGGLVPDSGLTSTGVANAVTTWQNAKTPTQTTVSGQTNVTVKQTAQQALLNWKTFNVGKNTTLNFDQSAGGANVSQWIAFNKISDPSGVPSQILGSIKAQGQVYVINQNGIIFGGSSQIDTHTFVASALPINDNLLSRGLLNNPDSQFLFSALSLPSGSNGTPAFNPPTPLTPDGHTGDVVVQSGAVISTPTTAEHVGGRVALIGANVTNAGTISTPDGQTILAAGLQVGLTAHSSSDASLRGLDAYVGAVTDPSSLIASYAGSATNSGLISSAHANVTITGKNVNQNGMIDSSTSVSLNGRIDLSANYNAASSGGVTGLSPFLFQATGTVTLGAGSVTQILPELSSTDTVVGGQLSLPSLVSVQGQAIHMDSNSLILAPGAALPTASGANVPVNNSGTPLSAGVSFSAGIWDYQNLGGSQASTFVYSNGQIYLDRNASINVAGSIVSAPISENVISVQLRGTELANYPLQRDGVLRGKTVQIDIRTGTPLADVSGYVNLVEHTVGELTTNGGTVALNSGGSVVTQSGSSLDVSDGWINYQGGIINTTKLISGSHIYDISVASPNIVYDGIYEGFTVNHAKWGITQTFVSSLLAGGHYESGYIQGGNGGAVSITTPSVALDGSFYGNTVTGPKQRSNAPTASSFSISFEGQTAATSLYPYYSPYPPSITFLSGQSLAAADAFALDALGSPLALRADRQAQVYLSPDLLSSDGFGTLKIDNSDGNITVPAGVALTTAAGGSITLAAANIDIEGRISSPGGKLNFSVTDFTPFTSALANPPVQTPSPDATRGNFTLGSSASLSTAGLIVDDRSNASSPGTLPLITNGGAIAIKSYNADLKSGSGLNVSGGIAISETGKRTYGNGGSISISAGQDPKITSILGGKLVLGSALSGYSGAQGGSLSILAPLIQIGGVSTNSDTLLLSSDFFSQGGFTSYTLNGIGEAVTGQAFQYLPGLTIAPNTVVAPVAKSLLAVSDGKQGNGFVLKQVLLPQSERKPVGITLGATGARDSFTSNLLVRGDVVLGSGSLIVTDAQTNSALGVSISGDTVAVLGSIVTPGGSITIKGGNDSTVLFPNKTQVLPTVDIGHGSLLSAAGATILMPDLSGRGYRNGIVTGGGSIKISGNIVAESGSAMDVSGASDVFDKLSTYSGLNTSINKTLMVTVIPTRVESNGGSIVLTGGQELFSDATLKGAAGGTATDGGSLSVSSGRFIPQGAPVQTPLDVTMQITQSGPTVPVSFYTAGQTAIGNPVLSVSNTALSGGHIAADNFNTGGFESLTVQGTVQFSGSVTLTASRSITLGNGGVVFADSAVNLVSSYVALGSSFQLPLAQDSLTVSGTPFSPTYGAGSLTVSANLIDIGNLSLQNIGKANFIADNGDIRGDGTLDVAGDIYLRAGQIYPPTAGYFTIAAYDHGGVSGRVTIVGSGSRQLPLSAGGQLNIYGSIINQGGVLRAPIGTINIGWDGIGTAPVDLLTGLAVAKTQQLTLSAGGITSVSAADPTTGKAITIPYGINLNGTSWIDPTGADITTGGVPSKSVNISAVNVDDQAGATIDIRGGGDLYAYRFVSGTGGTNDILASSSSFAIIPGYQAGYAPYAPYNTSSTTGNLGIDPGYVNTSLSVGDRVYLNASSGLPAGIYTLLPARYALLSGAFIVTPQSGTPAGATVSLADGSSIVSGYRFNSLNSNKAGQPLTSRFEVASSSVVRNRAEYDDSYANSYLSQSAQSHNVAVPRLPADSGQLVIQATQSMSIHGSVAAQSISGGRGGLVDISSPVDILIGSPGVTGGSGVLLLNASELSSFGAESLLVGGVRTSDADGIHVTVTTNNLTVNNSGAPLSGSDVILVANKKLTLSPGADIEGSGSLTGSAETLLLGSSNVAGSGDGTLLRVSGDSTAQISRAGVDTQGTQAALLLPPTMNIGAGAKVTGAGVILDSTYATSLDPTAILSGKSIALNSGQVSLQLTNPGSLWLTGGQSTKGLVLSGDALQSLQTAQSLSLLSYSSIDIYGTGLVGQTTFDSLALHAAEIRGFNTGGGTVTFAANNITLDNSPNGSDPGQVTAPGGNLVFDVGTIRLGSNVMNVDQYDSVVLDASGGIIAEKTGGLTVQKALTLTTPLITAATAANETVSAGGALVIQSPGGNAIVNGGLGATLSFTADSIKDNADIVLPSGTLKLRATGAGGVTVGNLATSRLDVAGTARQYFDLTKYTSGGNITVIADTGSVDLAAGSILTVAAQPGGGNAGSLTINAPNGIFTADGTLLGQCGTGGVNGTFTLDVGSQPTLATLNTALNSASFTESRSIRVRTGGVTVDGLAKSHSFNLSADQGTITVTGTVDASGTTGGTINLEAYGSVVLNPGSVLTVAAQNFDSAGKGGAVTLEAGSYEIVGGVGAYDTNAVVDIQGALGLQPAAQIDLSVAANIPSSSLSVTANTLVNFPISTGGNDTITSTSSGKLTLTDGTVVTFSANTQVAVAGGKSVTLDNAGTLTFAGSAALGNYTGTLHLRAPRVAAPSYVAVNPINGNIVDASSILVEGYKVYDLTASGGTITNAIETTIKTDGNTFAGSAGTTTAAYTAMMKKLFSNNTALKPVALIAPGVEIVNRTGNLTLAANWDLSTYRFGTNSAPGVLTLRAAGNLNFNYGASLSDGFTGNASINPTSSVLWQAALQPVGTRSWSYRLVAGADFGAADFRQVLPMASLGATSGSLLLGKNTPNNGFLPTTTNNSRQSILNTYFQTIRTGTGDIEIATGRDLQLLNPLATIYTSGSRAASLANFDQPVLSYTSTTLGTSQTPTYAAQFSLGGGNVTIRAQNDIARYASNTSGPIVVNVDASTRELPTNWLYRRGHVDSNTGLFDKTRTGGDVASTSWWIDFSNFFEDVGALGGGNVTLVAGHNVSNVDAVIPTNARSPKGAPDASKLIELGGGNLVIRAGNDINGGVYYVERGNGQLSAVGSIHTNSTRAALTQSEIQNLGLTGHVADSTTWLPTTLFLGKGSFDVTAIGDLLLGSVVNAFLLPQGINNSFYDKTYFSTYAATDAVNVSSLTGTLTIKDSADGGAGSLTNWYQNVLLYTSNPGSFSQSQPWLRLAETSIAPFSTVTALMPGTLRATAFSDDIDIVGRIILSPSSQGTVDLAAAGAINGVQPNGVDSVNGSIQWGSGSINLSDADPSSVPGIATPRSYAAQATGFQGGTYNFTSPDLLNSITSLFNESGSTSGTYAVLQTKQALHASGLLHANDFEPVHLYALGGDISGVTLFSAKAARVVAGQDITDIALYVQNVSQNDISIVSAGRDIIAYDPNSSLRLTAQSSGNELLPFTAGVSLPATGSPTAGDIQISGPGTLEVLAGRNLDLGVGPNNSDGTALGITSVGNARNPYLPFTGADVVAGAGIGGSSGLEGSQIDFGSFIAGYLNPATGGSNAESYLPVVGGRLGLSGSSNADIWTAFGKLPVEKQDALALDIFYLVLRNAGRNHSTTGNYATGYAAISSLFPGSGWKGDISLTSREIKTKNGGNIGLFAPGGKLTVGFDVAGTQAADQGILTEHGGNISIFTNGSVIVGTSRIFTLRGGNEIIWSSTGDIAAGASSKTVQSAPPTRVLIDPQSGDVQTDLAGLATGGGIGVLATVTGVAAGDVDLIAPVGSVDAGDAGIRVSGNLNIAAAQVLNASNIQTGGTSTGASAAVSAPNISGLTAATTTGGAGAKTADDIARKQTANQSGSQEEIPSIITVEVLGYGG